ncbi:hypothetical protein B0H66DRAFT_603228 [Apodospora peruviana]|uniref:Uncharacterized protein n=1 Tax=Apodospora peruviana TaxID=516989 RepID=A0AAE0I590_9PEZI|nr:hypothetical protein B0H66DRAFT_603228 [Apodospora peruviana]
MAELSPTQDGLVTKPVAIEGRSMIVLYGSETGNGEEIALELAEMAQRLHFQTVVDEMDSFKLTDLLRYSHAIFVTSTTGQGDMPKNTAKFWRNLRREKLNNTNCLGAVNFAIFGLGDSSYPKFNWAARKLRARLLQLGASEFFRPGEGDERHDDGIDSIYLPWYQELRVVLLANYPLPEPLQPLPDDIRLPPNCILRLVPPMDPTKSNGQSGHGDTTSDAEQKFLATKTAAAVLTHVDHPRSPAEQLIVEWDRIHGKDAFPTETARQDDVWETRNPRRFGSLDKDNIITDHPDKYLLQKSFDELWEFPPTNKWLDIKGSKIAEVVTNHRITPVTHWQDVRQITLAIELEDDEIRDFSCFYAGATVVIYPKNFPEDVQTLITMMGWEDVADYKINWSAITNRPKNLHLLHGGGGTLRDLLIHNIDFTAVPKRSFIKQLVHFTELPNERERLKELSDPHDAAEFYDYTSRPRRTILEVLRDFPGVKIPYQEIIGLFPLIRGREFSVAEGGELVQGDVDTGDGGTLVFSIIAALVEYKTVIRKPREGLCSRYLKWLAEDSSITVTLNLPGPSSPIQCDRFQTMRPLIAIATGTGIAPIKTLIEDRNHFPHPGQTILFFGCRNKDADFYFQDTWEKYKDNVKVIPAFSRDPIPEEDKKALGTAVLSGRLGRLVIPDSGDFRDTNFDAGKNYVQYQLRKHAHEIGDLLRKFPYPIFMVCGNAGRMPAAVRSALIDALVISKISDSKEAAAKWLDDKDQCTYWQETW